MNLQNNLKSVYISNNMKAKVIFSNFFTPEKADSARKLLEQLHIEPVDQSDDESLPKIKIITKSINEIPYNNTPECLTVTPLCLQYIISANESPQKSDETSNSSEILISNPFELEKHGNFFFNLFLFNKRLAFGNINEEEKERLTSKINYMGGKVLPINNENISYILTENKCDNIYHVPLVLPQWIDCLFESSVTININRYRVDESEATSANGSPNTSSSKRHILLTFPKNSTSKQSKSTTLKSKNASSQPVTSLKAKPKRASNKFPTKIDSRQMVLNFAVSSKQTKKTPPPSQVSASQATQALILTSDQHSQNKIPSSQSKPKLSRKSSQPKTNDILKIDNFMKLSKNAKPAGSNQLTILVENENGNIKKDDNNDDNNEYYNEYDSNDEAIEPEIVKYDKILQKNVQKRIDQHNQRLRGKLVDPENISDDEDLSVPALNSKNIKNNTNSGDTKISSLKKLSMLPTILNSMTENHHLSSDNDGEDDDNNKKSRSNYNLQASNQWENKQKELVDFSSDYDSVSPKRLKGNNNDISIANNKISDYLAKGYESVLLDDLTSFSQSTGESQSSIFMSNVYYDKEPKKIPGNDDSQKTESIEKDPLLDCWDMLQTDVNVNNQ